MAIPKLVSLLPKNGAGKSVMSANDDQTGKSPLTNADVERALESINAKAGENEAASDILGRVTLKEIADGAYGERAKSLLAPGTKGKFGPLRSLPNKIAGLSLFSRIPGLSRPKTDSFPDGLPKNPEHRQLESLIDIGETLNSLLQEYRSQREEGERERRAAHMRFIVTSTLVIITVAVGVSGLVFGLS